jgi:hypothetical protein
VGDDVHAGVATIDGGHEVAEVAREVGLVPAEPDDVAIPVDRHDGVGVSEAVVELDDVVAELRAQPRLDVRRGQRMRPSGQ